MTYGIPSEPTQAVAAKNGIEIREVADHENPLTVSVVIHGALDEEFEVPEDQADALFDALVEDFGSHDSDIADVEVLVSSPDGDTLRRWSREVPSPSWSAFCF